MNVELPYDSLISELNQQFPQYTAYLGELHDSIKDNVSVYFTFFSVYVKEHWEDQNLQQQVAHFLLQMHASADEATQIILHDFLLDICSSCREHDNDIHMLAQHLTPNLQMELQQINRGWTAAACELPRGCC